LEHLRLYVQVPARYLEQLVLQLLNLSHALIVVEGLEITTLGVALNKLPRCAHLRVQDLVYLLE